jgi:hypothetical protein
MHMLTRLDALSGAHLIGKCVIPRFLFSYLEKAPPVNTKETLDCESEIKHNAVTTMTPPRHEPTCRAS